MFDTQLDTSTLQEMAEHFETAYPQDVLAWAVDTYGHGLAVVTSFQPTGIVTLHMLHQLGVKVPVITLDTGLLFPETYDLIRQVEDRFDIQVQRVKPAQTVAEQTHEHGDNLWQRDPDLCCHLRKVLPLRHALAGYAAWVTGMRRDQSARRANTPVVSWDERRGMVKLCPFATWTESMVWAYINIHDLPYNTLHEQGYPSIGCHTCTHPITDGTDPRAGRWAGHSKTECGIQL